MRIERIGVLDLISISAQHDTCLILPTLKHAGALWIPYRNAVADTRASNKIHRTKTSLVMIDTRTLLRLWVPYSRDPTMPMDWEVNRRGFVFVSPYGEDALRI